MNQFSRSAREQQIFESLIYPGSDPDNPVFINKLNITDPGKLEQAERYHGRQALKAGLPEEAFRFDVTGLKAIHKTLLSEIYTWAGEFRSYTTGRGPAPFAVPEYIEPELNKLFEKLEAQNHLVGKDPNTFAAAAAHYVNEINAIHPFIDGNGRTQRIWLRNLGEKAGYDVRFRVGDKDAWNAASAEGFYSSDEQMAVFIEDRLVSLEGREQQSEASALLENYGEPGWNAGNGNRSKGDDDDNGHEM